ncbi:uncharacterized protein KRP23_4064 [Phytophthora ramorum]|uniref:uncharacterized protein n=1 Tax=Phytophthora ramorum TaxID=164328 RepID=UPI00309D52F7|nr:hypothetical protein KRP23_4064 [Phytophthora ramorum]
MMVCKDHVVLLRQNEKFVDERNADDYALHSSENARRTQICNVVGCGNANVDPEISRRLFCDEHLPVINDIRARIMMAKCHGDEVVQISLRYNEISPRKFLDEGHVEYYNSLVAKHEFVVPTVHVKDG